MTTYVIYEGPSLLDGRPIVALAITHSKNQKTGDMVQTYILRSDMDPITANRTGADASICGSCPLKGKPHNGNVGQARDRDCYVTLVHGPRSVWKTKWRKPRKVSDVGWGRVVRLGTYGDPAAVPASVWAELLSKARGWTGYTHQENPAPEIFMSSVETLDQARSAWARGERTYRIVASVDEVSGGEILCPATREAGKRTACEFCLLCAGTSSGGKSIAAVAHGTTAGRLKARLERTHAQNYGDRRHKTNGGCCSGSGKSRPATWARQVADSV